MAKKNKRWKKSKYKIPAKKRPFITNDLSLMETLRFNDSVPLMEELYQVAMPILDKLKKKLNVGEPEDTTNEFHTMSILMVKTTTEYSRRAGSIKFMDRLENTSYRDFPYKALKDDGYVMLYTYDFKGFRLEHRYLMDIKLGRVLETHEEVHHRDFNRSNNAIDNLQVLHVREHKLLHAKLREDKNARNASRKARKARSNIN